MLQMPSVLVERTDVDRKKLEYINQDNVLFTYML